MRYTERKEGTNKRVTKFLILPMCIGTEWRWLEKATIEYKWVFLRNPKGGTSKMWIPIRYMD